MNSKTKSIGADSTVVCTIGRRSLLKSLGPAGAAVASGMGVVSKLLADGDRKLTRGDADILRFLAAVELLEADFWQQYNELAMNNALYAAALSKLDADMVQYVADNTDDEMTHGAFLNAYLVSQGEAPVNLEPFRTLPSSPAHGARQVKRITNLTALTVDTSWWIKYRSKGNPDFGDTFPQLINIVNRPSIPCAITIPPMKSKPSPIRLLSTSRRSTKRARAFTSPCLRRRALWTR